MDGEKRVIPFSESHVAVKEFVYNDFRHTYRHTRGAEGE